MSLSGAIEAFPIAEVLKFLAGSGKAGVLRVSGEGLQGKVFVRSGRIAHASSEADDAFPADLIKAGLVDAMQWSRVENGDVSITEVLGSGVTDGELREFHTEHINDVMFRLMRIANGSFDFTEGVAPRYGTGHLLDVNACLAEVETRLAEWQDILDVIPSMDFRMVMAASADNAVSLDPEEWRLLAGLQGVASVEDVARRLGSTQYQVAKVMSGLVRRHLVETFDKVTPAAEEAVEPAAAEIPVEAPAVDEVASDELIPAADTPISLLSASVEIDPAQSDQVIEPDRDPGGSTFDAELEYQPIMRRRSLSAITREFMERGD